MFVVLKGRLEQTLYFKCPVRPLQPMRPYCVEFQPKARGDSVASSKEGCNLERTGQMHVKQRVL